MQNQKQLETQVWESLKQVIDPELNIDIVSLGLIYKVEVTLEPKVLVFITLTLTTPGCPLAGVFDTMISDALRTIPDLDVEQDIHLQLSFDPPWVPDMMSEEAKAELGINS